MARITTLELTEGAIQIAVGLFHMEYVVENEIPREQFCNLSCAQFISWIKSRLEFIDAEEEAAASSPRTAAEWEELQEAATHVVFTDALYSLWPAIIVAGDPAPRTPLASVTTLVLFRYRDGAVNPMVAHMESPDREAIAATQLADFLANNHRAIMQGLVRRGLDSIHSATISYENDAAGRPIPNKFLEGTLEQLFGLVLLGLEKLKSPLDQEAVKNYMRLLQYVFLPLKYLPDENTEEELVGGIQ